MREIPGPYRTPHGLDAALRSQILARSNAVLATINPDGSPHLTELLFYLDDKDRVLLPTPQTTKKVRNVLARHTVTVFISVESGWASCAGAARVITGEEAERLNRLNRERVLTEAGMETMDFSSPPMRTPRSRSPRPDGSPGTTIWSSTPLPPSVATSKHIHPARGGKI
jgi:hypothetical protein